MQRGVSRVLLLAVAVLMMGCNSWSKSTSSSTVKNSAAKVTTSKPKSSKPATATPKTVLDYFMLLPQDFFEFPISHLKSYLHDEGFEMLMVDKKNDYLRMAGDAAQATIYMALFRYKGRVLVGTYSDGEGGGILHLMRY